MRNLFSKGKKIISSKIDTKQKRVIYPPSPEGFHGDKYLLSLVESLMPDLDVFIETGSEVGSTLTYVANAYPDILCLSCEPDEEIFKLAQKNINMLPNVQLYNMESQGFLKHISEISPPLNNQNALFWLDAHGFGFQWPLRDEITFILTHFESAYILIDDFKVPGMEDVFGYDSYQDQDCSLDYIKDILDMLEKYTVCYPAYSDHTSTFHPLRGWGLIIFGDKKYTFPPFLQSNIIIKEIVNA